ncbi:MAG: hypothetical protein ACLTKI_06675, partial [Lachnospiraceae bacterium]
MKKQMKSLGLIVSVAAFSLGMAFTSMAGPTKSSDFGPGVVGFQPQSQPDGGNAVPAGPVTVNVTPAGSGMMNVSMNLNNIDGTITYQVYVNHGGYLPWKGDGVAAGGTEGSTHIECIRIDLTGNAAKQYDIYYTGKSSGVGQHGWAKNGQLLG